jgi:hypothetical protein
MIARINQEGGTSLSQLKTLYLRIGYERSSCPLVSAPVQQRIDSRRERRFLDQRRELGMPLADRRSCCSTLRIQMKTFGVSLLSQIVITV